MFVEARPVSTMPAIRGIQISIMHSYITTKCKEKEMRKRKKNPAPFYFKKKQKVFGLLTMQWGA